MSFYFKKNGNYLGYQLIIIHHDPVQYADHLPNIYFFSLFATIH